MAKLQCPHCGAPIGSPEGWAKAALATLVPAPAVPGMATQVRCPQCRELCSQPDGGQAGAWRGLLPAVLLMAVLLAVAVFAPA